MPVDTARTRNLIPALSLVLLSLALAGCGDHYSDAVRYGVRTDPLVLGDLNAELTQIHYEPDRPGLMPIISQKDLENPLNPMHVKRDVLFKDEKKLMLDPLKISDKHRDELDKALIKYFGTPAHPKVTAEDAEVVGEAQKTLGLTDANLEKGSRLYRIHCLHCHGVSGDGRGPTAKWVNPHPRDYRQAIFKFQSVDQTKPDDTGNIRGNLPPRRADLRRTLEEGIEGTSMPSFALLGNPGSRPDDLDHLVSYVMHLSIRGKTEYQVIRLGFTLQNNALVPGESIGEAGSIAGYVAGRAAMAIKDWVLSEGRPITPTEYKFTEVDFDLPSEKLAQDKAFLEMKDSVHRGFKIFSQAAAGDGKGRCTQCHKDFGRRSEYSFDDWGTMKKPANLTLGTYRGGRRPVDLYSRVHSGINGVGMPSSKDLLKMNGATLERDEIWDIVNFLRVLPYPAMRQKYELPVN